MNAQLGELGGLAFGPRPGNLGDGFKSTSRLKTLKYKLNKSFSLPLANELGSLSC